MEIRSPLEYALHDKKAWLLVGVALIMNLVFLSLYHHADSYLGIAIGQGEIAYNVCNYNSIKVNGKRCAPVSKLQKEQHRLVDFAEVDHAAYGPPTSFYSLNDTIGYGVILGLLWKLTHSYRYLDIQLLQIFLYCFILFLVYAMALMWFGDPNIAFAIGCAYLLFLPLFRQNVLALRDIWAYYGVMFLLYGFSSYYHRKSGLMSLSLCSVVFSLCQWVRPTVVFSLAAVCGVLGIYALCKRSQFFYIVRGAVIFCFVNLLFFWAPFMAYNKVAHGRYFASPAGQMLLEGMGEYENKWGFECSDEWVGRYMLETHGVRYGTLEFNDKAKEVFWNAVKQDPLHYLKTVARRLPQFFLPGLSFNDISNVVDMTQYSSWWQKVKTKITHSFSSPLLVFDFFTRQIGMRLFLLLGYLGLFLALLDRKYLFVSLFYVSGILSAATILSSHIEYRYLTPFYGVFPFFVGYAGWYFWTKLRLVGRV